MDSIVMEKKDGVKHEKTTGFPGKMAYKKSPSAAMMLHLGMILPFGQLSWFS